MPVFAAACCFCFAESPAAGQGTGGSSRALLPDLINWAGEAQGYIYGWTVEESDSRKLLRLSTTTANIGEGPLELRGGPSRGDGTQDVLQRVYNGDGSFEDRLAGVFQFHSSHDHIHFEGFAEYNLREVLQDNQVGDVVATSGKTSFCLVDVDAIEPPIVGAPEVARYKSCDQIQGISVGWADLYNEGLPDQWIDVTDVPYGSYWLEVIADPDDQIEERDETNNSARILIDYGPSQLLPEDRYEPNEYDPANLRSTVSVQLDGLTIHSPGDDDLYRWTAPTSGVLTVEATVADAVADLNMFVYSIPLEEIGFGVGTKGSKRVVLSVRERERYIIRVIGEGDDVISDYSLSLAVGSEEIVYPQDDQEPNVDRPNATPLSSEDVRLTDLTIHSAIDIDYFHWIAPNMGTLHVSAIFTEASGDLELRIYSLNGVLLGSSVRTEDGREVLLDVRGTDSYFIRVSSYEQVPHPSYSLDVKFSVPEPATAFLLIIAASIAASLRRLRTR